MTVRLNPNPGQEPTHYVLCDGHNCSRVNKAPLRRPWRCVTMYGDEGSAPTLLHFHHGPCMVDWAVRHTAR